MSKKTCTKCDTPYGQESQAPGCSLCRHRGDKRAYKQKWDGPAPRLEEILPPAEALFSDGDHSACDPADPGSLCAECRPLYRERPEWDATWTNRILRRRG